MRVGAHAECAPNSWEGIMHAQTEGDVSYCVTDGHVIFLDVSSDRYFHLPEQLEKSFLQSQSGRTIPCDDAQALTKLAVLPPAGSGQGLASPPRCDSGIRSMLELDVAPAGMASLALPEVIADLLLLRRGLRYRILKDVLDGLVDYRREKLRNPARADEQALLRTAARFRRARALVPIETRCLLDSLALCRFLARRGIRSQIIFGITYEPFSAHCWVQADDLVLNETIGGVMAYTPIRVV